MSNDKNGLAINLNRGSARIPRGLPRVGFQTAYALMGCAAHQ